MATCLQQVGVKNIMISFKNCDTGEEVRNLSHKLATDELPKVRTCESKNEALPGGFSKRSADFSSMMLNVIRDRQLPISYYQGCAAVDIQIEYFNGNVVTGVNGAVTNDDKSDMHEVEMEVVFESIDELLPEAVAA
jgi:hypothetical protein